jgi:hypothetical protein
MRRKMLEKILLQIGPNKVTRESILLAIGFTIVEEGSQGNGVSVRGHGNQKM